MVREDNPNKQEWGDFNVVIRCLQKLFENSQKYTNAWHGNILDIHEIYELRLSTVGEEERCRRLIEQIHSINEAINNPAEEIRKKIKSNLLEIETEINKLKNNIVNFRTFVNGLGGWS